MKKIFNKLILIAVLFTAPAMAHERHFEKNDFSQAKPFEIQDSIVNAKAVYARLETGTDIDVYTFTVSKPIRLYTRVLIPLSAGLARFLPSLAVAGPGLPPPDKDLPFSVPEGYGVVVVKNVAPGEKRPVFYEPFSGEKYYDAPAFDQKVSAKGKWYIYFWDPYKMGGDYVAILGYRENFF
jgi:hypothetical protein